MVNYHPQSVAFLITDRCNGDCNFCGIERNVNQHDLPVETILNCIDQAYGLGIPRIGFSGGEPFLRYEDMLESIRYANSKGVKSSVVTNASYAKDKKTGFNLVRELKDAGLENINISFDADHLENIPFDSYVNAIEGALSNNLKVDLKIVDRTSTEDTNKKLLDKLAEYLGGKIENKTIHLKDGKSICVQHLPVIRSGRAKELDEKEFSLQPIGGIQYCNAEDIVVKSNGDILPCCSFPAVSDNFYVMGNAQDTELKTVIKRINEHIIGSVLLSPFSFKRIRNVMENSKNPEVKRIASAEYVSPCEFCGEVFSNPSSKEFLIGEFQRFKKLKLESVIFEKDGMASEDRAKIVIGNNGVKDEISFMNYLGPLRVGDYFIASYEHELERLEEMEKEKRIDLSRSKRIIQERLDCLKS